MNTHTHIYIYRDNIYIYTVSHPKMSSMTNHCQGVHYRFHNTATAGFVGAWSLDDKFWSLLLWITVSQAQHSIPNSKTSSALIYRIYRIYTVWIQILTKFVSILSSATRKYRLQWLQIYCHCCLTACSGWIRPTIWGGPFPLEGHAGTVHSILFLWFEGFDQPAPLENKQSDNSSPFYLVFVMSDLNNFFPE